MFERREERVLVDIVNFVILVVAVIRHGRTVRVHLDGVVSEVQKVLHGWPAPLPGAGAGVPVVRVGPVMAA